MNVRRCLLGMSVSLALAAVLPQAASAQVAGETEGVTAGRGHHGGAVIRFSKRSAPVYRQIAGRRVIVGCATVTPSLGGYSVDGEGSTVVRAPRRRQTVRTYMRGKADYCFVRLRKPSNRLVAMAPVTQAGRTYLDELKTARLMLVPFSALAGDRDTFPPTTEQAVADGYGSVVALDGPDGVPPKGKAGYWTDGTRAVVAAVTERGRRLFFEVEGDVVRTNVLSYLQE